MGRGRKLAYLASGRSMLDLRNTFSVCRKKIVHPMTPASSSASNDGVNHRHPPHTVVPAEQNDHYGNSEQLIASMMILLHMYLLLSEGVHSFIRSMSSKLSHVGISLPLKERSTCPLMPRLSTRRIFPIMSFSGPLMIRILSPSR